MKFREVRRLPTLINLVCFSIAVAVSGVFLLKRMPAVQRGFFCGDDTLRYPYLPNTIPIPLLVATTLIPAVLLVMMVETVYGVFTVRFANSKETSAGVGGGSVVGSVTADRSWPEGWKSGLANGGLLSACMFYGNCLCYSLTEVFKLSFGTLRPSFLAACRPWPDVTSFPNCSAWFVEDVVCQNPDRELMMEMRKSFLSGHASFAVYHVMFIMLYLQRRLPVSTPRLLVSLSQALAVSYAIFICGSRIYDHYHHPPDVLGGALLGMVVCWITVFKICPEVFRHPPRAQFNLLPTQGPKQAASLPPAQGPKQGTSLPLTSVLTKE